MITWMKYTRNSVISDGARFTIRWDKNVDGQPFYNAWDGDKHIGAGYSKDEVKKICEERAEKSA